MSNGSDDETTTYHKDLQHESLSDLAAGLDESGTEEAIERVRSLLSRLELDEEDQSAFDRLVMAARDRLGLEAYIEQLEKITNTRRRRERTQSQDRLDFDDALIENYSALTSPFHLNGISGSVELLRNDVSPTAELEPENPELCCRVSSPVPFDAREAIKILAKFYKMKPSAMRQALRRARTRRQGGVPLEPKDHRWEAVIGSLPHDDDL